VFIVVQINNAAEPGG